MEISPIKTAGGQKKFNQGSFSTDSAKRFYKTDVKRIIRTQGTAWTTQDQMPTRNGVQGEVKKARKVPKFGGSVSSIKDT